MKPEHSTLARTATSLVLAGALAGCSQGEAVDEALIAELSSLHDDPAAAQEFFSAASSASAGNDNGSGSELAHYLTEVRWPDDDMSALTGALVTATTHPELIADPDSRSAHDAALIASESIHHLAHRDDLDALITQYSEEDAHSQTPEHLARILGTYLTSIDRTLAGHTDPGAEPGLLADHPAPLPRFTTTNLGAVSELALSSRLGVAELRSALSSHRTAHISYYAGQHRDGEVSEGQLIAQLRVDARREGFFANLIAQDLVDERHDADSRADFWILTGLYSPAHHDPSRTSASSSAIAGVNAPLVYDDHGASSADRLEDDDTATTYGAQSFLDAVQHHGLYSVGYTLYDLGLAESQDLPDVIPPDEYQRADAHDQERANGMLFSQSGVTLPFATAWATEFHNMIDNANDQQ